jgi:hypothetical protein
MDWHSICYAAHTFYAHTVLYTYTLEREICDNLSNWNRFQYHRHRSSNGNLSETVEASCFANGGNRKKAGVEAACRPLLSCRR